MQEGDHDHDQKQKTGDDEQEEQDRSEQDPQMMKTVGDAKPNIKGDDNGGIVSNTVSAIALGALALFMSN